MRRPCLRIFYVFNILWSILLGTFVYVLFRRDTYIYKIIAQIISIPVISLDDIPAAIKIILNYYVSDALWAYALEFSVFYCLMDYDNKYTCAFSACCLFEIVMEFLQKWQFLRGTFDWFDICVEILSNVIALYIIKIWEDTHEKKNNR